MTTYDLHVTFSTDVPLTDTERLALFQAVMAQIDDPAGIDGHKRARYTTTIEEERLAVVAGVCPECGDAADTVIDGFCRECSQAWELEMCLHCGQDTWVNVWGECGDCESDQYTQHREGVTQ